MKLRQTNTFSQIDTGQSSLMLEVTAALVLFGNSLSAVFAAECCNTGYLGAVYYIVLDSVVKLVQFLAIFSAVQESANP